MSEIIKTVIRKAPVALLAGGLALGGVDVLAACSSSNNVAACQENWPNASTPKIGNTAVAFGALQTAIGALRARIEGVNGSGSEPDSSNGDDNGPFYYVGDLAPNLEPAAGAVFLQDDQNGTISPDYALGPATQLSTIGEAFCKSGGNIFLSPKAVTAVGNLLVAGISPNLDTGLTIVTVSPSPSR